MSAIQDIGSLLGTSASTVTQPAKLPGVMNKEDFLMLLIEQLKNQDPMNPQDPTAFTAQLAQFSSLEQLFNVGDSLTALTALTASMNNVQASSFLGREVEVDGASLAVNSGNANTVYYSLPDDAASTTLTITDSMGNVRRTVELGAVKAGEQQYAWNGQDDNGVKVADGNYTYAIAAKDAAGNSLAASTYRRGVVTGVVYDNGTTLLEMDGQRIPVTDIRSVRIQETTE